MCFFTASPVTSSSRTQLQARKTKLPESKTKLPESKNRGYGGQQTHPGYGSFTDHGGRAGDALEGHREGPGPHPMGNVRWQNRCSSHFGHGRWPPPRWGNPLRWSGCWRSCCGSSSTRLSSSTPPTCRSPPGGVAATLAPRTTDWRWCSNTVEPDKKEVYWFHEQIHVEEYPWAFKNGDPKRRIAALEMLGTLFLCNMILTHQGPLSSRVRLPVGSDNQGNVMAMLNLGSKKPYTAAILMELPVNSINGLMS